MARRTPPARVPRPSISRSTSSRVVWTANDARASWRARRGGASAAARSGGRRARRRPRGRGSRPRRAGGRRSKANEQRRRGASRSRGPWSVEARRPRQALERVAGDVARRARARRPSRCRTSQSTAAPRPIASATGIVPASNLRGRLGPRGLEVADAGDHVPAAEERRHRLEQLAAAVQHADAGRPVGLVAGPGVEVGAERGDVDRQVRHGLRAVDQHERAGGVRALGDLGDRVDRAEHVGDVGDGDELRAGARAARRARRGRAGRRR